MYQPADPLYHSILFDTRVRDPLTTVLPLNSTRSELEETINSDQAKEQAARWRFGRKLNPLLEEGSGFEGHLCFLPPATALQLIVGRGLSSLSSIVRNPRLEDALRQIKRFLRDPAHPIHDPLLALELNTQFAILLAYFRAARSASQAPLAAEYYEFISDLARLYADQAGYRIVGEHNGLVELAPKSLETLDSPTIGGPPLELGAKDDAVRTIRQLNDDERLAWDYMLGLGRVTVPGFALAIRNNSADIARLGRSGLSQLMPLH